MISADCLLVHDDNDNLYLTPTSGDLGSYIVLHSHTHWIRINRISRKTRSPCMAERRSCLPSMAGDRTQSAPLLSLYRLHSPDPGRVERNAPSIKGGTIASR